MNKLIIALILIICSISISFAQTATPTNSPTPKVGCDLCEFVVSFGEYLVKNGNLTKAQLETDLKQVCTIVPSNITEECKFFMLIAAPVIAGAISNGENPVTICSDYKLCPTTSSQQTPTIKYMTHPNMDIMRNKNKDISNHINNIIIEPKQKVTIKRNF
ncbi:hypothetical protein RB653_003912 [Dictyostelium firmibasis]|uniref:Saposin B-type domain-containing protein n=1 Tax=Dictyostelium firmibasis TaxID=79012 RepID=A0AAN7TYR0_9MYCE